MVLASPTYLYTIFVLPRTRTSHFLNRHMAHLHQPDQHPDIPHTAAPVSALPDRMEAGHWGARLVRQLALEPLLQDQAAVVGQSRFF